MHEKEAHEVQCHSCDSIFFTEYDLKMHTLTLHKSITKSEAAVDCLAQLRKVSENRILNYILEKFALEIENTESCSPELNSEASPLAITSHFLSSSPQTGRYPGVLPFDFCTFRSESNSLLEDHIMSKHNAELMQQIIHFDDFPFNCSKCVFGCSNKSVLDSHMTKKHEREAQTIQAKSFPCQPCGIVFGFEETLHDHITRIHPSSSTANASLPFPCPTCGTIFEDINELNLHVKRDHNNSEENNVGQADSDLRHYLKYILEQNQEMMEDFHHFKQSVHHNFNDIFKSQEELKNEFNEVLRASKNIMEEVTKFKDDQKTLAAKAIETFTKRMEVLENHHLHISNQVAKVGKLRKCLTLRLHQSLLLLTPKKSRKD